MSYGRRVIYTDLVEITPENIVEEVRKAWLVHNRDRNEITVLDEYYRGKTKIQNKTKEVRENINHKIAVNHAYEVTSFHKGNVFGEPIQYVRRETAVSQESDEKIAADINALNGYMVSADKAACDDAMAKWIYVAGTSYRLTLPNNNWTQDGEEPPFKIYSLDPRQTRVVYSNGVDKRPMFSIYCVEKERNERVFCGYTDTFYYEFNEHEGAVKTTPHALGMNPIIEYPSEESRLGVFEPGLPLLDAIDELQSNRMDDVVQYVNSFLAILGGQLDEETYKKLNEWKTLCLPEGTDAKYLSPAMKQQDIQTLKDDLYQSLLTVCGVPNRNGGSSTSDTGVATVFRDGWQAAETRAKSVETNFKLSEKPFLKLVLRIMRDTVGTSLKITDIVTHFTRRNYENIASKSQVLISMLNNPKIHPELAFSSSGLFVDPESAYLQSMAWLKVNEQKALEADDEIQDNDPKTPTGGNAGKSGTAEKKKEGE